MLQCFKSTVIPFYSKRVMWDAFLAKGKVVCVYVFDICLLFLFYCMFLLEAKAIRLSAEQMLVIFILLSLVLSSINPCMHMHDMVNLLL